MCQNAEGCGSLDVESLDNIAMTVALDSSENKSVVELEPNARGWHQPTLTH